MQRSKQNSMQVPINHQKLLFSSGFTHAFIVCSLSTLRTDTRIYSRIYCYFMQLDLYDD